MALNVTQRAQLALLPIADSSFDEGDRWAVAYIAQALSTPTSLTDAQRWQVAHLPIADSSLPIGDRFALAHVIQSLQSGGAIVDIFDVTWVIDPTWTASQLPQANDGSIVAGMAGFVTSLPGRFGAAIVVVPNEGTPITNSQATDGVGYYEICSRTGFKQLPIWHPDSKFIQDGYGDYVRAKSADDRHPQDHLGSGRNTPQEGPQSPEPSTNTFISTSVSAEDL